MKKFYSIPLQCTLQFGSLAALAALSQVSSAQSTSADSFEWANNIGTQNTTLASDYTSGSPATANITQSWTGMNGAGNQQTMTFAGTAVTSAQYGSLHSDASGMLTNSYYNVNNSNYVAPDGSINDPNGSPTTLSSIGFAFFSDTLQYGGVLQSGYMAKYIFHVDGNNIGGGTAADLDFTVGSNPADTFFDFNTGPYTDDWVSSEYAVNGITPQSFTVQFSTQSVFNTYDLTDGQTYSEDANFSSTLTLAAIEVVDQNGTPVSGWTVTSASGTQYPTVTPEPAPIAAMGLGLGILCLARRRRA